MFIPVQITDKLSHIYGLAISFAYFEVFFLKILTVKNFSPRGVTSPPRGRDIAPIYTKNLYDLTIAIIKKCFEFQNDWLKIGSLLGTITRNFVLYHCVKGIDNFEQHQNFLSDMHQNLISTRLY